MTLTGLASGNEYNIIERVVSSVADCHMSGNALKLIMYT